MRHVVDVAGSKTRKPDNIEYSENDYRLRCLHTVIFLLELGEGVLPLCFLDD